MWGGGSGRARAGGDSREGRGGAGLLRGREGGQVQERTWGKVGNAGRWRKMWRWRKCRGEGRGLKGSGGGVE